MATISITVQSILNAATFDSYSVSDGTTVGAFKSTIATAVGIDTTWFTLSLRGVTLTDSATLAACGVIDGDRLYTGNQIDHLTTREDRQVAKLTIAELRRRAGGNVSEPFYRSLNTYNVELLPMKWSGNTLVDNPNPGGLIQGRPWT